MPELLDMFDVACSIITADAMHCQKTIVAKISDIEADYVIGLKRNQGNLFDDVKSFVLKNARLYKVYCFQQKNS